MLERTHEAIENTGWRPKIGQNDPKFGHFSGGISSSAPRRMANSRFRIQDCVHGQQTSSCARSRKGHCTDAKERSKAVNLLKIHDRARILRVWIPISDF